MKVVSIAFQNVEKLKYLGRRVTNQNYVHEETDNKLKSGNACYHSVQSLLPSRLPSKTIKIKIYKTNSACSFVWL
jgi:hypothetical protein